MRSPAVVRIFAFVLTVMSAVAIGSSPTRAAAAETRNQGGTATKTMPKSMGELMQMSPEQCFQTMDTGHKGFVTKAEFMKFQEQLWRNMDKSNKGKVTEEEFMYRSGTAGG